MGGAGCHAGLTSFRFGRPLQHTHDLPHLHPTGSGFLGVQTGRGFPQLRKSTPPSIRILTCLGGPPRVNGGCTIWQPPQDRNPGSTLLPPAPTPLDAGRSTGWFRIADVLRKRLSSYQEDGGEPMLLSAIAYWDSPRSGGLVAEGVTAWQSLPLQGFAGHEPQRPLQS